MADPVVGLAAVSAVSGVLQLLDFATKVTRKTHQLVKSAHDTLPENRELEDLVRQYEDVSKAAERDLQSAIPLDSGDTAVVKTARDCQGRAKDILDILHSLRTNTQHRGVKRAVHGAVKVYQAMNKTKELERAHDRLDESNRLLAT